MAQQTAHVLWAVKIGRPDWEEEVMSNNPEHFDRIKPIAEANGYDRFREAELDMSTVPDFGQTLK